MEQKDKIKQSLKIYLENSDFNEFNLKSVIFDMDGTVLDSMNKSVENRVEYIQSLGVDLNNEEIEDLSLAYAVSIHKAQGSEFDLVIIDDAHLLDANEYNEAIKGKQVIICGELQLQSVASNNLISVGS